MKEALQAKEADSEDELDLVTIEVEATPLDQELADDPHAQVDLTLFAHRTIIARDCIRAAGMPTSGE